MLPPAPPAFVEPRPLVPHFWGYNQLSPEERRLLEASASRPDGHCHVRRTFETPECACLEAETGESLYKELAEKQPVLLANLLNQTVTLANRQFNDGRHALEFVKWVERLEPDRLFLEIDPRMESHVATSASWRHWEAPDYIGPEFAMLHAEYSVCYRENRAWTSQQLSFNPSSGFTHLEVDIDEEGPTAGNLTATWSHLARVAVTHLFPGNRFHMESDAYDIGRRLKSRGIPPHYDLEQAVIRPL
jgi:hypothetical protein